MLGAYGKVLTWLECAVIVQSDLNVGLWPKADVLAYLFEMDIRPIADQTDVLPTLIDWYRSEWEPYYGIDGPGDARADLQSRCNRQKIPIGLVAVEANQVLGTASLDLDVTTNLTPSVVGLLVGREYRRKGIATALLKSAENIARQLDYSQLYISTTVLGHFLIREGWKPLGSAKFLNDEQGEVYVRDL